MVSFQPLLSPNDTEIPSKKRKWNHDRPESDHEILPCKHLDFVSRTALSDIELRLDTPLPSEWQRCLDIQSGEIHFYNTRTNKRTMEDPSSTHFTRPTAPIMSLDLELNLPCGSGSLNDNNSTKTNTNNNQRAVGIKQKHDHDHDHRDPWLRLSTTIMNNNNDHSQLDAVEMVAAVCRKCHMLVMLCKSSPTCPNCKFVHPPY